VTVEIERKFLVNHLPDRLGPGEPLRQGYLAEEGDVEVRLRLGTEAAVLTIKAGRGQSRTEVETVLSDADGQALWAHTVGRRLVKVRHRLPLPESSFVAEVDVYGEALTGLCTVEVEFTSAEEADDFVPPSWFGAELTGHREWGNASLARRGRPPKP
jgi:adenylate cyclase